MKYEAVIGLEIHAELNTSSKMFCRCKNDPFHSEPNENICPICIGLPGTLPVINKKAVESVIMAGLALNCKINKFTKWDRKNYFYPDLPKGYQISQYDLPLTYDGYLDINGRRIGVTRIHLEEDTGKLLHPKGENYSLVDYNRSTVPLMELVSEPDIRNGKEAAAFAQELKMIFREIGISKANMEKGEMRVEVNISLRPAGQEKYGTKVEIKNLNSFVAVEKSVDYEIKRQADLLDEGKAIVQETRGWNEDKKLTFSQRIKETAMDYRYFPEPDLPPVEVGERWLKEISDKLPELPAQRRARYAKLGVGDHYAEVLVLSEAGRYFDKVMEFNPKLSAKTAANWLIQENVNYKIPVSHFSSFVALVEAREISGTMGKEVLLLMNETLKRPEEIIVEKGLKQIDNSGELSQIADMIIKDNPQAVKDYASGKQTVIGFLVGQMMRETGGQADAKIAQEILLDKLSK